MLRRLVSSYDLTVGVQQRVADRSEVSITLDVALPGGPDGIVRVRMSPEDGLKLSRRISKYARAAKS
jgi:hypothetical protein